MNFIRYLIFTSKGFHLNGFWLFLVFSFLFPLSGFGRETAIERELAGITLGMSVQEVEKKYELAEITPWFFDFLTKEQREAGYYQTFLHKAQEKTYSLKGTIPPHAKTLQAVFLKGQLYLIILEMNPKNFEMVEWSTFINTYVEKYGPSSESAKQGNNYKEWTDGKTQFEITKTEQASTADSSYFIKLVDISLETEANMIWGFVKNSFKAEKGDIEAQDNLATYYYFGWGTEKDYEQAYRWWLKAASKGNADSQFSIGLLYSKGKGVKKDLAKAIYWYENAAQQGHTGGQTNLGYSYQMGEGVDKDYKKAFYWTSLAANQGDSTAQSNLGEFYRDGLGVVQDYVKAHMWFNISASKGLEEAIKQRKELSEKMAPEQIAAAQKLALEWKPPKTPKDRKWNFAQDIDGDGQFTIDDVPGWVGWLFYYPGDRVIQWLLSNEKVDTAHFFKITPQDYGGGLSFLFSLVGWGLGFYAFLMVLGVIAITLDRTDEFSRSVAQDVKNRWENLKKKKNL